MVKKKSHTATTSSTSGGAVARSSSTLSKGSAPGAPLPNLAPPAPPNPVDKPGDWAPIASGNLQDSPNDTSEGRGSSVPVDFPTVEHAGPESERDDPIDSETVHTDFPPSTDDACDADRDAFVNAAMEVTRASPAKRSTGGFADEDDLFDIDEGFAEPPPKKARSDAIPSATAAYEASAPKAAPTAQASTASSLSKGKDALVATTTPPSDLRGVISSLEAFASQFTSLEADKVRLQKEVESSSSKLEGAVKIAAKARQEIDSLKEGLGKLKGKLKEEETSRLSLLPMISFLPAEAANIPANALDKVPNNSPSNGLSMALASHQLTRELLEKGKGAMAWIHSMIFPKISQDKTLGELIDVFAIETKEVIEVFPVPASIEDSSGALSEDDRIQRMKDRITQLEKDLRSTYALAAIIKKKGEIAAEVERYALTELHKATKSLNFISLNRAEENKRIHERVHALTQLSSSEEIFWREQSKASAVA
ncbi:hypothetical protein QYE76_036395 [Lolium multiflorum]|uniref:Uncharacterized protein n=1 Tax=Lolium multiflorum TaxID=4521 RepID=A0AAD8VM31_LOLMU|nr:hypothetical protein QYE76_036395 [Lolium multiflorum]